MLITDKMLNELSDAEALAVISSFGFSVGDFATIHKIGGAKALLSSNLVQTAAKQRRFVQHAFDDVRRKFDLFYASGGWLITCLTHGDSRLFRNKRAPLAYFARYQQSVLASLPMVAVVGAREASLAGLQSAAHVAAALVNHGITVVSGGARGVDQAAHAAALRTGGATVVVSGAVCKWSTEESILKFLPQLPEKGLMVYPFGPFLAQERYMFVERNHFVAALADALIVLEGKEGSGTLHTARFAEEMQVPIYCLNDEGGRNERSFAPNFLLQSGKARLLGNLNQFAQSLVTKAGKPLTTRKKMRIDQANKTREVGSLPHILRLINECENSVGFDELLSLSGLSYGQLQRELLDYELNGRIFKRGSQFVLTGN